jgi:hypothetical protein
LSAFFFYSLHIDTAVTVKHTIPPTTPPTMTPVFDFEGLGTEGAVVAVGVGASTEKEKMFETKV